MIRPLLCILLTAGLSAQGGPGLGGGRHHSHIMSQLNQIRAQRIQQSLGISEERARGIADRWGRFDQDFLERHRQTRQLKQQLNGILLGPGSDDEKNARLKPLLQQFSTLRRQQFDLRLNFENEITASLSPAQKARLIILVDDFQRHLREAMKSDRRGE